MTVERLVAALRDPANREPPSTSRREGHLSPGSLPDTEIRGVHASPVRERMD